jgi:hypothetical protein
MLHFPLITKTIMPRFELRQSGKLNLTSYSGLVLIGQCCQAAQVEAVIDPRLPVSQGTFVMDNSDTRKEYVSRTYQGVDGYTPIALCLGNGGLNIGLELRACSHHSALETEYFLERSFSLLQRLCPKDAHILWRDDSGFDSAR